MVISGFKILLDTINPLIGEKPDKQLVAELKTKVQEILTALNPELVIHDFRLAKGQNNTEIMFDCSVPYTLQITKQQIIKHLKDNLDDSKTKYKFSIDIDRDYI